MASESSRKRLPFEPGGKSGSKPADESPKAAKPSSTKKSAKKPAAVDKTAAAKPVVASKKPAEAKRSSSATTAIPQVVSDRMLRRMLAFSGLPTGLGILTFFVSYYLVANQVVELPSYFVLLVTLGCFGLDEFKVNFGRVSSAWGTKSER
jgi:Photosynthesis affected mutant 68